MAIMGHIQCIQSANEMLALGSIKRVSNCMHFYRKQSHSTGKHQSSQYLEVYSSCVVLLPPAPCISFDLNVCRKENGIYVMLYEIRAIP